jgi:putative tryptophan/tyrosine transport system substrate-binding protein
VALDVEVIVVLGGTQAAQAAKHETSKIPIVFAGVGDAVGLGLVDSLARPGGNLTGVTYESVVEKHVDLLRAFVPNLERVGSIWQPSNPASWQWQKDLGAAATSLARPRHRCPVDARTLAQTPIVRGPVGDRQLAR